jgi:VIT1/CCC1 family predicted Fe2+/Mn2+ transporter
MFKVVLFMILVFSLGFVTLYSSAICDRKWFKAFISVMFSALVTMLVTFNIFR